MNTLLKLREGFSILLNEPYPDKIEWAFFISYVVAIAFALLSYTFTPGFWGGIFGGFCIASVYFGVRLLSWIRSSSLSR